MSAPWPWILAGLRRTWLPVFLLLYLAGKLLAALVVGDAPQPQAPPQGYTAHTREVQLSWYGAGPRAPFRVQVIGDGGDFDAPLIERTVRSHGHALRDLEPDRVYRWRVVEESTGRTSRTAWFRTARYPVSF